MMRVKSAPQAMTEYLLIMTLVITATMVGLGGIGSQKGFVQYIGDYYLALVEAITMPIP